MTEELDESNASGSAGGLPGDDRANGVLTGVSSGIGFGLAEVLTHNDIPVFSSVRNLEDVDRLRRIFGEWLIPLVLDVTDTAAVKVASERSTLLTGGQHAISEAQRKRNGT